MDAISVDQLPIDARSVRALHAAGYRTITQTTDIYWRHLLTLPGIAYQRATTILVALQRAGIDVPDGSWILVPCPQCKVDAWQGCVTRTGRPTQGTHASRKIAGNRLTTFGRWRIDQ
jgi:hypothetical protein